MCLDTVSRLLFILIPVFFTAASVEAQNTFTFKAQVIHTHQGPQKKIRVLINNQVAAITDDSGIFQAVLPRRTTSIKITLTQGDYHVLYPFGGYVAIPRDLSDIPQIIIGSTRDNSYLQQYISLYSIKKKMGSASAIATRPLTAKMDSLRNLLLVFRYTENDIKKAEKLQDGKDEYYPMISADITDYLRKTYALITAFRLLSPFALDNPAAMQAIVEAGTKYNESYVKIDRQQLNYQRSLSEFWQNDSLTNAYRDLSDFSLTKIHAEKIFSLQAVILQMKQYAAGKKKKVKERKIVEEQMGNALREVEPLYLSLEKKTLRVLALMDQG
jgi:hypothetical protein